MRTVASAVGIMTGALGMLNAMDEIVVSPQSIVRSFARPPVGINVNHLMDAEAKRPPGSPALGQALSDMGIGSLRFPEGELGDGFLWAEPPFPARTASQPQWALRGPDLWPSNDPRFSTPEGRPRPDILDFDTFMSLARRLDAAPVLIVAYDSAFKAAASGSLRPSVDQLRLSAAEWVRYANRTRGWGIRYWEIGNETDIIPAANSSGDPGAERYAQDVIAFSAAMKAVDPSIRIGVNIWRIDRWKALLAIPALGAAIDYVSLHNYPVFGWSAGYDRFRAARPDLVGHLREAETLLAGSTWAPADRDRLEFLVTETNVVDWSKQDQWPNIADLGHALVAIDLIGQTLSLPRVSMLQLWCTRWIHNDADQAREVFDALDPANRPTLIGRALGMWGRHTGSHLVAVRSPAEVIAYASTAPAQGRLSLILLNRGDAPRPVRIRIEGTAQATPLIMEQMAGDTPADLTARWLVGSLSGAGDGTWTLTLPALSVTALTHQAAP